MGVAGSGCWGGFVHGTREGCRGRSVDITDGFRLDISHTSTLEDSLSLSAARGVGTRDRRCHAAGSVVLLTRGCRDDIP